MTARLQTPIPSVDALGQWAQGYAPCLRAGDVLALIGPMGAGKTTLTQCLGKALNVQDIITSPTFGLIHEYQGLIQGTPCPIIHVDFYRLEDEAGESIYDELANLYQEHKALMILEWPKFAPYTQDWITWTITLHPQGTLRVLTLEGPSEQLEHLASGEPQ